MMALILGFFFVGITFINYWYGIVPEKEVTVLSQIGKAVFGHGILYYILQFATALILAVAANTGFSAFPVLAYNLAKDKFMPPHVSRSWGSTRLFQWDYHSSARFDRVAVYFPWLNRTLDSVILYRRVHSICFISNRDGRQMEKEGKKWLSKSIANITGAFISYAIIAILFVYRLGDIWPFFIIMPIVMFIFYKIHDHYKKWQNSFV